MKKSAISLSLLLLMGATTLTACNGSKIKPLRVDGKDVLFSIGDKNYTADELLGSEGDFTYSFLKSEEGAQELYKAMEKAIVKQQVEVTDNIRNAVEIKMEDWKEKVKSYADENGLTKRIAEQTLLEQEGFETRKDLEDNYTLQEQKSQFIKDYKADHMQPRVKNNVIENFEKDESLLKEYVQNTHPMIMKHVLVKTADTAGAFNQANITEAEADKLGTAVKRLATGNKKDNTFAQVAIEVSEDGSKDYGGNLGIVDEYTSFVNEFKFGVYSSLAYNAKKANNGKFDSIVKDLNLDAKMFEEDGIYANMGTIEVSDAVTALIDNGHKLGKQEQGKEEDTRIYPRNIEFNKNFNFSGVKYLHVADKEALASQLKCSVEDIKVDDNGYVLDDMNNPIIVTRSEFGIHFISVTWSSLDHTLEESVKYFMTDTRLKDNDDGYYLNKEFNKGHKESDTTLQKNRKNEIEDRVINYVQGGYAANITADEQIMTYKMMLDLQDVVKIPNETVKKTLLDYINLKINTRNTKISNEINKTVKTYNNKVEASISAHKQVDTWLDTKKANNDSVEGGKQ